MIIQKAFRSFSSKRHRGAASSEQTRSDLSRKPNTLLKMIVYTVPNSNLYIQWEVFAPFSLSRLMCRGGSMSVGLILLLLSFLLLFHPVTSQLFFHVLGFSRAFFC